MLCPPPLPGRLSAGGPYKNAPEVFQGRFCVDFRRKRRGGGKSRRQGARPLPAPRAVSGNPLSRAAPPLFPICRFEGGGPPCRRVGARKRAWTFPRRGALGARRAAAFLKTQSGKPRAGRHFVIKCSLLPNNREPPLARLHRRAMRGTALLTGPRPCGLFFLSKKEKKNEEKAEKDVFSPLFLGNERFPTANLSPDALFRVPLGVLMRD